MPLTRGERAAVPWTVRNYVIRGTARTSQIQLPHPHLYAFFYSRRRTASKTSSVLLLPPRSGVRTSPSLMT
jgi:hypothetical protein